jgi:hypothetical protein
MQTARTFGKLIGGHRRACGAYQPVRLFQNVGICRLFSRKKAEHHKRRAKYQAYEHNFPIGAFVRTVKRTRHKSPATKCYSYRAQLPQTYVIVALQRFKLGRKGTRRAIVGKARQMQPPNPGLTSGAPQGRFGLADASLEEQARWLRLYECHADPRLPAPDNEAMLALLAGDNIQCDFVGYP